MTSLEFFPPSDHTPRDAPVWGTGRGQREPYDIWTPRAPSWQCGAGPTEEPSYTLTSLQLSNNRLNDQLLPNPQHADVSKAMIDLPFPAEHPYSSHISRMAMFPKYDEPQKGESFDVKVVSKTKGSGLRHEIQSMEKKPLHWHSHDFDHLLKYPDAEKQLYYPTPPVLLNPNGEGRSDDNMTVYPRTADTMKNVARDQWNTTYDRNYTGLGPANPSQLDNYGDKPGGLGNTPRPSTMQTFNPARPMEGRIARDLVPPPLEQTDNFPAYQKDPHYKRKMTLTEKEEDRLLHGQEYINLPDSTYGTANSNWQDLQTDPNSALMALSQRQGQPEHLPYGPAAGGQKDLPSDSYFDELSQKQHDQHQQMEAQNRWQILEAQKPNHNIQARQHKMDLASVKEQPAVFYNHEGKFQRERSGLYKTTYDPYALQNLMNQDEKTGPRLMDYSDYHKNALDLPTALNNDVADALRYNRTLGNPGSIAQLHSQPSLYEAFGPFDQAKALQKAAIQPNAQTADVRTQENGLIQTESEMGTNYNTKKFLQENSLPLHARNEPLTLMSNENKSLNNVKLTTKQSPTAGRPLKVPDDILTGDPLPGSNWMSKSFDFGMPRPSSSPELKGRYSYSSGNLSKSVDLSGGLQNMSAPVSRIQSRYGAVDQKLSKSTNFLPTGTTGSWATKSAYESQFPVHKPIVDMSYKKDERFDWKPDSGRPKTQTKLLDIQNSFSKSDVRKKFHQQFAENGPDLRDAIVSGRRHAFNGVNAQILRGTPMVDL